MSLVCSGASDGPDLIALTFDDGPSECTAAILDTLEEHGARATFFVVGRYADERPELLRRMRAARHEVGNHTYDHVDAAHERDNEVLRDQIARTTEAIERAGGPAPRLLRPPYGKDVCRMSRLAAEAGLDPTVLWSVQAWDWDPATTSEWIVERVLAETRPGAIVLLHDGTPPYDSGSREATVVAVRKIVPELMRRGHALVTVSELLAA